MAVLRVTLFFGASTMKRVFSTATRTVGSRRKRSQYRIASLGEVLAQAAERGDKSGRGLAPVFDKLWVYVANGTENADSIFHVATLATVCDRGFPRQRSMVLRSIDRGETGQRVLRFNCDTRSPKVREIRDSAKVGVFWYSKAQRLQVRCTGIARISSEDDDGVEEAWKKSDFRAQRCYAQRAAPSSLATLSDVESAHASARRVSRASEGDVARSGSPGGRGTTPRLRGWALEALGSESPAEAEQLARSRFANVVVDVSETELLYIASSGHRRIRESYGDGHVDGDVGGDVYSDDSESQGGASYQWLWR